MGRIRRGGYVFEFWIGDHPPRHVHVLKDRKLVAKVELDDDLTPMEGKVSGKLRKILHRLIKEGAIQ